MKTKRHVVIEVSQKSVFFVAAVILSIIFFQNTANLIIGIFTSVLVFAAINPVVNFFEKKGVPRTISASLILLVVFTGLASLVASLISPIVTQTQLFVEQLPSLIEKLAPYNINLSSLTPQLYQAPGNVLRIAVGTFSGLVTFFTLLVITFYILQDRPNLRKHLHYLFGDKQGDVYYQIASEVEVRLGAWVRGMVVLMFVVGLLSYFGFSLIGLSSAIPLAVIAGVLEIIPNVGPTIAAVPAVIVGFSISPTHGLMALGLSVLVQQLENNIIVPKIMQSSVGLHPVVTIIALLIGFQLGGPLLAILSLPIILTLKAIFDHIRLHPKETVLPLSD